MNECFIRALMVEPMKYPRDVYLESTMSALKSAVSIGCDELCEVKAKKLEKGIYAIFNQDMYYYDLQGNRKIGKDIIAGIFYVLATDANHHPQSLSDNELQKYLNKFWEPEHFTYEDIIESMFNEMDVFLEKFE